MRLTGRAANLVGRIALVVLLLAISVYLMLRPYLGAEDENLHRSRAVTAIVDRGPATAADTEWTVNSIKAYTRLVEEDGRAADVEVPAGAVIVVVEMTVKAGPGRVLDEDGFMCPVDLTDDRGNVWDEEDVYGIPLQTSCADDDRPTKRGVPTNIGKVFVVPKSAVPHLLGVIVPGDYQSDERVLIRP